MKVPSTVVGIDLGNSSLKAVRLQKKGDQYAITRVAMLANSRNPQDQSLPTEQAVAAQIKEIAGLVKASGAEVHLTINSLNSTIRYVELPHMPLDEVRAALKLNSAAYLRQSFENYTFDICSLDAEGAVALTSKIKKVKGAPAPTHGKSKALVAGISTAEVVLYFHAVRRAGIKPSSLQLAPVSLINAFETAYPQIIAAQAVALLDVGFFSSSFTILERGQPSLTRSVPIGGKHVTDYMAQISSSDFAKAEAAKLKGDPGVGEAVARTCAALVREVRGSINFFEKNSDHAISKIYLSGASARLQAVVDALSQDIGVPCEVWNAANGMLIELPADQQSLFTQNQVAFAVAIGAARSVARGAPPVAAAPASASKPTVQPPVGPPAGAKTGVKAPPPKT